MDSEIRRMLRQIMNKGAFVNGAPTSETFVNTTDSLEAVKDIIGTTSDAAGTTTLFAIAQKRLTGRKQILEVSVTSAANAGDVTLATITTQPCYIRSVVIHADAAQTGDMTSCGVFGGASKVVTLISAATAVQASLNQADKQVNGTGPWRFAATKTIVMTLVGTGATAVDLTVTIEYEACVDGGYLA